MTRDAFREYFIKPLEDEFGVKVFFNGEHKEHRITDSRVYGFWNMEAKVVVIRSQECLYRTLGTLIHEMAHSQLHSKRSTPKSFRRLYGEAEAYHIEEKTLERLNVPWWHWRASWVCHYDRYVEKCLEESRRIYPLRYHEIKLIIDRILRAYQPLIGRFSEKSKFKSLCNGCYRDIRDRTGTRIRSFEQMRLFPLEDDASAP